MTICVYLSVTKHLEFKEDNEIINVINNSFIYESHLLLYCSNI